MNNVSSLPGHLDAYRRHTALTAATLDRDLHAKRRRYGRPGPKSLRDIVMRQFPPPGELLSAVWLYAELGQLRVPTLLDGDQPWRPPAGQYGFRPVVWGATGQPATTAHVPDPGPRILASRRLFDRGRPIRIVTTFHRLETEIVGAPDVPPRLWRTALTVGSRAGYTILTWNYASARAAHHGHARIVHAIQNARRARRHASRTDR